jgi:hypothetical protein
MVCWMAHRAHLEETLKESEIFLVSAEIQTPHFGSLGLRLRGGIKNDNREVDVNTSKHNSYSTLH